jgi:hypothetical protein
MTKMNCVDNSVWTYFNTLPLQVKAEPQTSPPANPIGNFGMMLLNILAIMQHKLKLPLHTD